MNNKIKKIRELNDNLRQNFSGGKVMVTRGIADLPQTEINNFMTEATSGDYNHLLQTAMAWFNVE